MGMWYEDWANIPSSDHKFSSNSALHRAADYIKPGIWSISVSTFTEQRYQEFKKNVNPIKTSRTTICIFLI